MQARTWIASLVLITSGITSSAIANNSPNIILIIADDQPWNGTSVQMDPAVPGSRSDYHQTPNLETLASEGIRFSAAYTSPSCRPSQVSLQSGKSWAQLQRSANYSEDHKPYGRLLSTPLVRVPMEDEMWLVERIKEADPNYRAGHFGKYGSYKMWHFDERVWKGNLPLDEDPKNIFTFTNRANNFIQESVNAGKPFFVEFTHRAVKPPWEARPETISKYESLPKGDIHKWPKLAAMTEDLDTSVGMILQKIRDLDIEDNTYVIYTSDNGKWWSKKPLYGGKGNLWEGGIRVPMIIKGPDIAPGMVSDVPIIVTDLFTTITELAGATYPTHDGIEGANLVPILENGGELPPEMPTLQRQYAENGELFFHLTEPSHQASAVIDGDFKLLKTYGERGGSSLVSSEAGATAMWTGDLAMPGAYNVYVWWSAKGSNGGRLERDSLAEYEVTHVGGETKVTIDQNQTSGKWYSLGIFDLAGDGSDTVSLIASGTSDTSADAIKFVKVSGLIPDVIVDNQDDGFAHTGDWRLSGGVDDFAEPIQRHKLFLFNLAQNITENPDLESPVNLASALPMKTAELHKKLNHWLKEVDASLPYDVTANVKLVWDADHLGKQEDLQLQIVKASLGTARPRADLNSDGHVDNLDLAIVEAQLPKTWRSTIDVDYKDREIWTLGESSSRPDYTAIGPHQPHLSQHAFRFDGNDVMERIFFHVSEAGYPERVYGDHSASFEFWFRLNSLDQSHLLFESGDGSSGLSLTLGNGDDDFSNVRFSVLGLSGNQIAVTSKLDLYADPTRDFVQVVAVLSDDPSDRHAKIYVNGALFARTNEVNAPGQRIDWDSRDKAGLGGIGGSGLGASSVASGSATPGLDGELAYFRYYNYTIDSNTVRENYNAMLPDVDAGVVRTSGAVGSPNTRPSDVGEGQHEDNDTILVIQERHDTLDTSLSVDILPQPNQTYGHGGLTHSTGGVLPTGTDVSSYLVHFDPLGDPVSPKHTFGTVTFDQIMLGILFEQVSLEQTDPLLGTIGRYTVAPRAFDLVGTDFLTVSDDLRSLGLSLSAVNSDIVHLRILTMGTSRLAGDANFDNMVSADDYASVQAHFGETDGAPLLGDANGDGQVSADDYASVQSHLGDTVGFQGAVSVPEPATLVLLALSGLALARRSRK